MSDDDLLDAIREIVRETLREELAAATAPKKPKTRGKSGVQQTPSGRAGDLATMFEHYMAGTWPNVAFTRTYAWAKNFDHMLKAGISYVAMYDAILWLTHENPGREFSFVIQSPKTFRERYGRILAQMEKPDGTAKQSGLLGGISELAEDMGL